MASSLSVSIMARPRPVPAAARRRRSSAVGTRITAKMSSRKTSGTMFIIVDTLPCSDAVIAVVAESSSGTATAELIIVALATLTSTPRRPARRGRA